MAVTYLHSTSNVSLVLDGPISNGTTGKCVSQGTMVDYTVSDDVLTIQGSVPRNYLIYDSFLLHVATRAEASDPDADFFSTKFLSKQLTFSFSKDGSFVKRLSTLEYKGKYLQDGNYIILCYSTGKTETFFFLNNALYTAFLLPEEEKKRLTEKEKKAEAKLMVQAKSMASSTASKAPPVSSVAKSRASATIVEKVSSSATKPAVNANIRSTKTPTNNPQNRLLSFIAGIIFLYFAVNKCIPLFRSAITGYLFSAPLSLVKSIFGVIVLFFLGINALRLKSRGTGLNTLGLIYLFYLASPFILATFGFQYWLPRTITSFVILFVAFYLSVPPASSIGADVYNNFGLTLLGFLGFIFIAFSNARDGFSYGFVAPILFAFVGIIFVFKFIAACIDVHDYRKKGMANIEKTGGKVSFTIVLVIIALLIWLITSSGFGEMSEINRVGSSMDWGPNHYWNTDTETVEVNPWKYTVNYWKSIR